MEINSCQPELDEFLGPNDYPLYLDYYWNGLNDVSSQTFPPNRLGMPDGYTLWEMAFKMSRGRTKDTEANIETDNDQSLRICALQGSPGNLYSFHVQTTDER